jgi:anthranilate/para-aminobenzoate synthase component I
VRRLELSQLEALPAFALLGPGFAGTDAWTLVTGLSAKGDGAASLWLAPYDGGGVQRLAGEAESVSVLLDEAPALDVSLDEAGFLDGVARVREAIAAGDVYQVNLTVRARVGPVSGAALLSRLCRHGVPRFAAWVRLKGGLELVSASPELLFEVRGRAVRAEPMKGTAAPGQRAWLEASEKDRAELAMITDLLRDDLHRLCEPRSVEVPCARRFIELPYVVQAVSDVTGVLREGVSVRDLVLQLHPGGSVTGAPREAARAVIAALERSPRGVYCGALGLEQGEGARFALLIRTAQRAQAGAWSYGVGSGITWDSEPHAELDEVRLKLGALTR